MIRLAGSEAERQPDASGRVRVLVAATFRQKKGIPSALSAIERVRRRYPNVEVTAIGDSAGKPGDEEVKQQILALVARLGEGAKCCSAVTKATMYGHGGRAKQSGPEGPS